MIGYYVHHQGEGHRRRATAVAQRLRSEVTGLGSGPAPPGWPGDWVELARDDDPPVPDPGLADATVGGLLHWAPRHHGGLLERHRQLVDTLASARPSLVVVDVSVEVSLLVRLCGIPVVVGGMPGRRTDPVHALAYDLAEAILAPWPTGAHPGSGWPQRWSAKSWEVGGISALATDALLATAAQQLARPPWTSDERLMADDTHPLAADEGLMADHPHPLATDDRRRVLVVWGSGGDVLDHRLLADAQEATPGWEWTVRGGGHPGSPDLLAEMARSDVVVCHGGQGAVADVALAERPAVVLAQPRPYDEQDATVAALGRLGLAATGHGWPRPDRWPGLLDRALRLGGSGWERWGGDGAIEAAARLDRLAETIRPAGTRVVR